MTDTTTRAAADYGTRRERVGWYFYDFANSAFPTTVITVFLGPYLTSIAERAAGCTSAAAVDDGCRGYLLHPLGIPVSPGSLFPYVVSLSVLLTVFVLPVVGAIADRSAHKRELLAAAAYVGAAATILLVFLTGERYLLGAALLVLANVAFGASVVIYHSFLPQIAEPDRRDAVSSIGWAIGFLGGGTLLVLNVAAVFVGDSAGWSAAEVARWSIVSAGVWWALFTTIPLRRLRNRPPRDGVVDGNPVRVGFRQLRTTLGELRAYPLTLAFLGAYLIYNDGIQTVISQASVYGVKELGLSQEVLVPTILMVQFLAFGGALGLGALAKRIGAKRSILVSLALWTGVLAAAYVLPAHRALPFIVLGGAIGLVLGGSQALSRSLFSQLIPAGKEAEYFSLYEISDRGTSWLGPLLFGLVFQLTGSYRSAIVSLLVFFVVGFVALTFVPVRRAIEAAGNTPPRVV
ncbi:MAG: transporter, family [Actinomycetota bacterium]|jgi:UMF1 family MFS transporter|nr:transporter [Cryptosporangiaceae bacterium]MDQ1675411.1 transporter, family [Actinomycetota bacterium]